jgi:hypothetical protein
VIVESVVCYEMVKRRRSFISLALTMYAEHADGESEREIVLRHSSREFHS